MFQVGELIVYGGEGVCRVEAVGPITMSGVKSDKPYYTLAPLYRMGKIYAPVDTTVLMRPVLSRKEAEDLIRKIPEIEAPALRRGIPVCWGHFIRRSSGPTTARI